MQQQIIDPFQAIVDPSRRHILQLLSKDSLTINELADNFDMSRPAVSKHVKVLYNAGFIDIENIGRERHCVLKEEGFNQLQEWLNYYEHFWKAKLKKLEDLMNKNVKK